MSKNILKRLKELIEGRKGSIKDRNGLLNFIASILKERN